MFFDIFAIRKTTFLPSLDADVDGDAKQREKLQGKPIRTFFIVVDVTFLLSSCNREIIYFFYYFFPCYPT